jgi:hypothetical protein
VPSVIGQVIDIFVTRALGKEPRMKWFYKHINMSVCTTALAYRDTPQMTLTLWDQLQT